MALAIQHIAQAMLEEDPEKAKEHTEKAKEALAKFEASLIPVKDVKLNMERIIP